MNVNGFEESYLSSMNILNRYDQYLMATLDKFCIVARNVAKRNVVDLKVFSGKMLIGGFVYFLKHLFY